jgi:hypothetical protein
VDQLTAPLIVPDIADCPGARLLNIDPEAILPVYNVGLKHFISPKSNHAFNPSVITLPCASATDVNILF